MLDDIDVARSQFRQAEKASKRVLHKVGKAVGITPELIQGEVSAFRAEAQQRP